MRVKILTYMAEVVVEHAGVVYFYNVGYIMHSLLGNYYTCEGY